MSVSLLSASVGISPDLTLFPHEKPSLFPTILNLEIIDSRHRISGLEGLFAVEETDGSGEWLPQANGCARTGTDRSQFLRSVVRGGL